MSWLFEITLAFAALSMTICVPVFAAPSSPAVAPGPSQLSAKAQKRQLKAHRVRAGKIFLLDDLTEVQRSQLKSLKKQLHSRVVQLRLKGGVSQPTENSGTETEASRNDKFGSAILGGLIAADVSSEQEKDNKGKAAPVSPEKAKRNHQVEREVKRLKREYTDKMRKILTPAQRTRLENAFNSEQVQ